MSPRFPFLADRPLDLQRQRVFPFFFNQTKGTAMGQPMVVPGKAAAQQWRSIVYVCAVFGVVTLYVFSMELKEGTKKKIAKRTVGAFHVLRPSSLLASSLTCLPLPQT